MATLTAKEVKGGSPLSSCDILMKKLEIPCFICGGEDVVRVSKEMPQKIGQYTTVNQHAHIDECGDCGEWSIESQELQRLKLQSVVAVFQDRSDNAIGGKEVRDARKILGFTQKRLAEELGRSHSTVCRWERGSEKVPTSIRLAVLSLAQSRQHPLAPGISYLRTAPQETPPALAHESSIASEVLKP